MSICSFVSMCCVSIMCACIHMSVFLLFLYMHAHAHTYTHTHTHTNTHTRTRIHVDYKYTHTSVYIYVYTYIHAHVYIYITPVHVEYPGVRADVALLSGRPSSRSKSRGAQKIARNFDERNRHRWRCAYFHVRRRQ